jgi:hypothetical protein
MKTETEITVVHDYFSTKNILDQLPCVIMAEAPDFYC